jgi:hypothetical protein
VIKERQQQNYQMLVINCIVFSFVIFTRVPMTSEKNGVIVPVYQKKERLLRKINTTNVVQRIKKWNDFVNIEFCQEDVECEEPMRCCEGLFVDYCCDIRGFAQKRKRTQVFPNITFPDVFPLPTPRPVPQPIPIPIPID